MQDQIKKLFSQGFLWGERKEINIFQVFKSLKLKPNSMQIDSKYAHCFIMVIILYFQEFLEMELNIREIKERYFIYFSNFILERLLNTSSNTREHYVNNLNIALDQFFDQQVVTRSNELFRNDIITHAAYVFKIHFCIIFKEDEIASCCFLSEPEEDNFFGKIIVIYRENHNDYKLLLNADYKAKFDFEKDGCLKGLENKNIENDYYKVKIFCFDVNSPFSVKKNGLIEIITKENSNDLELNLFTQDSNFVRSQSTKLKINNRSLQKPVYDKEKKEIVLSFTFQVPITLEFQRLDIYEKLAMLLDKLYIGKIFLIT
jgi:hypothetical protein